MERLEKALGYRFLSPQLLQQACTHRSYAHEQKTPSNERLEFLGDAVLSLAIAQKLMELFPKAHEGKLSKLRAHLVSRNTLSQIASHLELERFLRVGKGEKKTNPFPSTSILSCALEAVLGAIYLDGGLEPVFHCVERLYSPYWKDLSSFTFDPKTELQERLQSLTGLLPQYQLLKKEGPPHNRTFEVAVFFQKRCLGQGKGKSKKEAEKKAALQALQKININPSRRKYEERL